ncbi:MAG TPA: hypothetical protein PKJ41_05210 [Bryobacteraceae bacterium]|nr:hypothetical protein [Bryobacteraceae bacterium]
MRLFFKRRIPHFERVLLVESGSRYLLEALLPGIYHHHPQLERVDVITCFPGAPATFDHSRGEILRVHQFQGGAGRARLYQNLKKTDYNICGIVCSGEAVMTKWKWAIAAHAPAKVFILNENGDYFWVDYSQIPVMRKFVLYRAGLSGANAVSTIGRLALFPFTLGYLLAFAGWVHLRRKVRML